MSILEFLQIPRRNGITTLQTAIISQELKTIKLLLELGADINQIDLKSWACPLYVALKYNVS